jgi:hypothetical protein
LKVDSFSKSMVSKEIITGTELRSVLDLLIRNNHFDWRAPYLPDDLCFFRNDKEWLINTAHERFCAIKTDEEAIINEIKKLEGLIP